MPGPLPVLLHVEDNLGDVHLLREALQELDIPHRYLVAENAIQAYSHLRLMSAGFAPALVVVDLNLPVIRGNVVVRELRGHLPWNLTKLVVLTSSRSTAEHQDALAAGASECLVKPATFDGYLDVARRLSQYLTPPRIGRRTVTGEDLDRLASPDSSSQNAVG